MKSVSDIAEGTGSLRLCVYTTLLGHYEHLNDQPMAARSTIPFLCLTDNPDLKSESWQIRPVSPIFGMDPIRSQRDFKIRPHVHLPDFDASLYLDNSVQLTQPPESLFERHFPASGFCLPRHSYRDSTLDEFLEVAKLGLDDQGRIFEQLNHYAIDCPEILQEQPYWTAILLRDHRNPRVCAMLDVWIAHVLRYSRRDQLSVNLAFKFAGLKPDVMEIDNFASWFHTWPHTEGRDREKGMRRPATSLSPLIVHIRQLKQSLVEQVEQHKRKLAEQAQEHERVLREHMRQREELMASPGVRVNTMLAKCARFPSRVERFIRHGIGQLGRVENPQQTPEATGCSVQINQEIAAGVRVEKGIIYVDPSDERGRELVNHNGDLNPLTLRMWKRLISTENWTHVIDLGANYGEMLINVDLKPEIKVVAVEPNPLILPYLERTLAEAGIRAEIIPCAVAEHVGNGRLWIDHRWSGTTRLAAPDEVTAGVGVELLNVPITTLAALLGVHDSKRPIRALVKIDVEGQEINILKGVVEHLEDMEIFEALIEVFHLTPGDLDWLFERFEIQLYDHIADDFLPVVPGNREHFAALIADSRYYPQDVVLRPKPSLPPA